MGKILEQILNHDDEIPVNPINAELEARKEDFVIKDDVEYPDPEYLINIGGIGTMPRGNVVAFSAKWKNGKTFFCDIIASVLLGSASFPGLRPNINNGKVMIFDTEQAVSDTARIRTIIKKLTPAERHTDFDVFCLRNAIIEKFKEDDDEVSRYEFIEQMIKHEKPDLAIIDGIADLIYNYNDVVESQSVVNNIAALANENNCCIVVVMHQNKSKQDKSMKGHLGTMLFQKCSDVFNVEKVTNLFIVTHSVSRHRQCEDFVFKINIDGVPVDATADRQQAEEIKHANEQQNLIMTMQKILDDPTKSYKRKDIVQIIKNQGICGLTRAYAIVNEAIQKNILVSDNGVTFSLAEKYCESNTSL